MKFYKEQLKDLPSDEENGALHEQGMNSLEPKFSSKIKSQISHLSSLESPRSLQKIPSRVPDQEAEKEQAKEKRQ